MIQIGSGSYVRHADITQVISLTEMRDMSEIKCAYTNGQVFVIAERHHCSSIYLAAGRIFISPVSATTIRNRMLAADWSNIFDSHNNADCATGRR